MTFGRPRQDADGTEYDPTTPGDWSWGDAPETLQEALDTLASVVQDLIVDGGALTPQVQVIPATEYDGVETEFVLDVGIPLALEAGVSVSLRGLDCAPVDLVGDLEHPHQFHVSGTQLTMGPPGGVGGTVVVRWFT